jgi:FtsP/CotA-like multicopper oxidase with cupredoxin domain
MNRKDFSRRDFLQRASALGVAAVGGSSLLAACGGNEQTTPEAPATSSDAAAEGGCSDLTGLTEQEIQMRNALQYVDETDIPDKRCDNCQLYIPPEGGAACGACKILKGPVAPAGHCTSWAALPS